MIPKGDEGGVTREQFDAAMRPAPASTAEVEALEAGADRCRVYSETVRECYNETHPDFNAFARHADLLRYLAARLKGK